MPTRSDITSAYRQEVQRVTDITMRKIAHTVATHTGGRAAGMLVLAEISGAHRAQLQMLQQGYEAALEAAVEE